MTDAVSRGGRGPGVFEALLLSLPPLEADEPPVTRRFYLELVAMRQSGVVRAAAELLVDPRLRPALAAIASAAQPDRVRIAGLVELDDDIDVELLLRARDALAAHGLALDLWPQLPDARGRFLNTSTAAEFQRRLLPLLDALDGVGLALDLEPNEALTRAAWGARDRSRSFVERARCVGGIVRGVSRAVLDARQGRRDLQELARDLAARKVPLHVAVMPPLTALPARDTLRHWALGCPAVDEEGQPLFGLQAAMCYAGLVKAEREQQRRTLALWAAQHRTSFDAVVIGMTSTGILGDEPVYEDPRALAEDVRAMHALGFTDVGIYALEGVLFGPSGAPSEGLALRPDVDAWIAAALGRLS